MNTHQLIREGRHRLGMSEQQFADALQVSRSAVQQWEKPGGTAPKRANRPRVAELLGISVGELVCGVSSQPSAEAPVRTEVPLLSAGEAGNLTVTDNSMRAGRPEMVRVTVPVRPHTCAMRVHDDSMLSRCGDSFPVGSILIVEPELKALPGDYVIARQDGDEITFRQLVSDDGDLYLKPLNARYPLSVLGTAVIVGVVRAFTRRFR